MSAASLAFALEFFGVHLLLPLMFIAWLIWPKPQSRLAGLLKTAVAGMFMAFLFLAGNWGMLNFLRYLWLILYAPAAVLACLRCRERPWLPARKKLASFAFMSVETILAVFLAVSLYSLARACLFDAEPVALSFPFGRGSFVITDGGNGKYSSLMNYHTATPSRSGFTATRTPIPMRSISTRQV